MFNRTLLAIVFRSINYKSLRIDLNDNEYIAYLFKFPPKTVAQPRCRVCRLSYNVMIRPYHSEGRKKKN